MDIEQMRIRMGEMAAEIDRLQSENEQCGKALNGEIILCDSLRAQNARLQSIINEANAQQSTAEQVDGFPFVPWSKEKEFLESMRQSPAVEVPDGLRELIAACRQIGFPVVTDGMKYVIDDMQSALRRVQSSIGAPSPRITEQDAREIGLSAWRHWSAGGGRTVNTFIEEELGALLDKLNDKPEVSGDMQKALGALSDIANADDMTLEMARKKAGRIYNELQPESVGG